MTKDMKPQDWIATALAGFFAERSGLSDELKGDLAATMCLAATGIQGECDIPAFQRIALCDVSERKTGIIFGSCDCCGAENRVLHRGEASGLEAYACAECRYTDPREEAYEIEEEIDAIEADPTRHGDGEHRRLLLANLKAELARINGAAT